MPSASTYDGWRTLLRPFTVPGYVLLELMKTNKVLLGFAGQVAEDDLLPTRLPDKVKKPKWAKPRKSHGKASTRSFTGAEAAEITANQAE
jgi:hypothetical protein